MSPLTNEAKAFRKQVRAIERRWITHERASMRIVKDRIDTYLRDTMAAILPGMATEWQMHQARASRAALEQASARLAASLQGAWTAISDETVALALAGVDAPISSMMQTATTPHFVSEREAFLVGEFVPSLITNMTSELHNKVRLELESSVLGTKSGREIAANITKLVGGYPRAKVVMRTEMNRLHNLTRESRIKELAAKDPALGAMWLHRPSPNPRPAHTALHGTVIYPAKGEKFDVNGHKAEGPHDPSLPAEETINCHCGVVAHYDPDQGTASEKNIPMHGVLNNQAAN